MLIHKKRSEKEIEMTAYSKIRKMHTENIMTGAACGNGMPGFDAVNTDLGPTNGPDNKNKNIWGSLNRHTVSG